MFLCLCVLQFDGQLGRGLFLRPMPLAPRDGMLGVFVKLNRVCGGKHVQIY